MLNYTITVAISAFFVPHYIGGLFWEPLRSAPGDIIFGAGVIAVLAAINVVGIKESAGVNILLAVVDFLTQLLLVVVGAVLVFSPETLVDNVVLGEAPTWTNFVLAIPIGMIAYTGIETISNMAEEAKDERRTIPAAINRVRIAVYAIYFTLPAVALSALPVERDPATGEYQALIGVSRLVYSMGIHRQVPDGLRRLHPRYRTPWIGILVFGFAAIVTLLPGQAEFLGYMYAFGAMLSFTIAHISVMRLRATQPDAHRPYRGPWNVRVRGYDLPLFAVFGGLGTGIAFIVTVALHPEVAAAGFGWLIVGVVIYIAYRRHQGLDLVSTYKVALPQPVVDHEAEYDSVLVPLGDGRYDERVVATATKLAARRRRGIHVLALVTVPHALPIDAAMPDAESSAASMIEQAKIQGGRRVSGHVEKIRAGQAGRRIIEEATDMRAAAIVMPLPRRIDGASLFGKTLETVLSERPCRVIIESTPQPVDGRPRV